MDTRVSKINDRWGLGGTKYNTNYKTVIPNLK